jgi:hypothetical protein
MAVELTPRVSQDTTGLGFQVPVFRMNQGVNAATANPMSRAAMQPMEMVSEGQFGLNPNIMAMADETVRNEFFAGVDELNQFVNKAAEFGIDPSKVDMTVPESFALNQEFRKRVQGLQQQARAISSGAAQTALAEREANLAFQNQQRARAEEEFAYQQGRRVKEGILESLGGDVFVNEFRILDALSKEGITRGDVSAQNEFRARAASSIPALEQAYSEADDQAKKVIKPYLDKAKAYSQGKGIVFAPPPKGNKESDSRTASLGLYEGLSKKQLFENPVKISPTSSRVAGFALLSKTGDPGKNVLKRGSFDQEIDVTGYEQGFSYISKDGERIPVRAQFVKKFAKSFPEAKLVPAILLKGRANITATTKPTSIAQYTTDKSPEKVSREVVFVPSNNEWLMAVNAGYNDNAIANQLKAMLMQGGSATNTSGNQQGLDDDLVF